MPHVRGEGRQQQCGAGRRDKCERSCKNSESTGFLDHAGHKDHLRPLRCGSYRGAPLLRQMRGKPQGSRRAEQSRPCTTGTAVSLLWKHPTNELRLLPGLRDKPERKQARHSPHPTGGNNNAGPQPCTRHGRKQKGRTHAHTDKPLRKPRVFPRYTGFGQFQTDAGKGRRVDA